MPLLCTRCGAHNSEGRQACAVCGHPLAGAPVVQAPGQAAPAPDPAAAGGSGAPSAGAAHGAPEQPGALETTVAAETGRPPDATPPQPPSAIADALVAESSPPLETPPPESGARSEGMEPEAEGARVPAGTETPVPGMVPPAAATAQQYLAPGQVMSPQGPYPGFGYPVQMPYGYPAWQEGFGYLPAPGYGYPPMAPFGGFGGFPPCGFMPPMPWPGAYPQYGMPFYPQMQPPMYPGSYGGQAPFAPTPYAGPYPRQKQRMKTVYIVLIILGVLILIGGAVTAAILLTGNSKAAFKLGDGSVTGADIEFTDLVLKQEGSSVTLTGKYDNNTKKEGKVYVTVETASNGTEQLLSFTVPVTPGKGHSVNQKKTETKKLSQATLGALIFQSSSSTDENDNSDTYPWDSTPSDNSTSPGLDSETTPYTTTPYTTPRSSSVPSTLD